MKGVGVDPKLLRFAADLVERSQSIVNIERRVLDAFGHHWPRYLLKLQHKVHLLGARFLFDVLRETQQ